MKLGKQLGSGKWDGVIWYPTGASAEAKKASQEYGNEITEEPDVAGSQIELTKVFNGEMRYAVMQPRHPNAKEEFALIKDGKPILLPDHEGLSLKLEDALKEAKHLLIRFKGMKKSPKGGDAYADYEIFALED